MLRHRLCTTIVAGLLALWATSCVQQPSLPGAASGSGSGDTKYLTLALVKTYVKVGDSVVGTATANGPDASSAQITVSTDQGHAPVSGTGRVDFTFATTQPGDLKITASAPGYASVDKSATALDIRMAVKTVAHNAAGDELPRDQQENPGAFMPFNDDDDDYSRGPDYQQTGNQFTKGENDLLPIALKKANPTVTGAKYRLTIPSGLRVWQTSSQNGTTTRQMVTNTTDLACDADMELLVEGSQKVNGAVLKLNWRKTSTHTIADADRVKITTFRWIGPLNVPGYGVYAYKVEGGPAGGGWSGVTSGTLVSGSSTADCTVKWNGDAAAIGMLSYTANQRYIWDLDVNVVWIRLGDAQCNTMQYNNPPVQDRDTTKILSTAGMGNSPAMRGAMVVDKIEGPERDGIMNRGRSRMHMGFIQVGTFTAVHGDCKQAGGNLKIVRRFKGEGMTRIDPVPDSTKPWYASTSSAAYLSAPTVGSKNFSTQDCPNFPAVDSWRITYDHRQYEPYHCSLDFRLNVYFAVATLDAKNGSEKVYTQRAKGDWHFEGSGAMNATTKRWTIDANQENGGDARFTEVTDGSPVPHTADTVTCNQLLNAADRWESVPAN